MENTQDVENDDGQERRAKRQKTNHKSAIFEKLKQLKGKGSKNKYEVSEMENVFTLVNEKEYSQSVMERQDDWIVDDDGSGYVEDGRDIFDDDLDAESLSHASKTSSERKKKKNVSKNAGKGNIQAMLSNMPEKKKESTKLEEDEFLTDILAEIDDNASTSKSTSNTTFHQDIHTKIEEERQVREYMKSFSDPKPSKIKLKSSSILKRRKIEQEKKTSESSSVKENIPLPEVTHDDFDDEIDMEDDKIADVAVVDPIKKSETEKTVIEIEKDADKSVNITAPLENDDLFEGDFNVDDMEGLEMLEDIPVAEKDIVEDFDMELMFDEWAEEKNPCFDPSFDENCDVTVVSTVVNDELPLCKNEDNEKVFSFFWWDAYEDIQNQPGVIYLFGKTYVEARKTYESCCVVLRNVERKLYILPRPYKLDEEGNETNVPVKMIDVNKEWAAFLKKKKIYKYRAVTVNKKYAFDPEIPTQSDYLEVRCDASVGEFPKSMSGKTYSHVFGLNTNFLEIFLLDLKLKGPCWLEVKNAKPSTNPVSWCKYEVECPNQKLLAIAKEPQKPPPPLVVATLSLRTVPNKFQKNEIVMICCAVQNNYCVDKPPPTQPVQQHFCVFTKSSLGQFPPNLHKVLQNFKATRVQKLDSERALLNYFLTSLQKIDPDLIVGHDLLDFHLGNLSSRLLDCRVTRWSRIGKLKRSLIPIDSKRTKALMVGRLLCDLKVSAKELIKCRSYDLDALCESVLKLKENERMVLETGDVLKMLDDADLTLKLITLTMRDAGYITRMMYELNVMPLALQITKIAGNVMSQTLQGGRAQRNEFLLLHAFDERNYICPDKTYARRDKDAPDAPAKKKATYAGGLVLDPKVGFYDKLILLMDFNSLYPSIIQEFNICFTTMATNVVDVDEMLRNAKREPGILPAEIRKLVDCRREVKKLMAAPRLSVDLRIQYNIRQLALKLTANSMYGCLGFQNSRFFAKHLAALITMKGRDILMHTRDLVQSMGFEVIYGDTDSIMINTNSLDYNEAMQSGKKIKQTVNKFYKKVELDVDGVFKYMLLLKKKKYAAVTMSRNKEGQVVLEQEHKGLDIVRRDWSMLASNAGKMVLNQILSEQSSDERIESIQNILQKIGNDLRNGEVPFRFFVITKQLTKDLSGYKEKGSLSHVLVAERYNQKGGKPLVAGDTVPYVICEDGTNASSTQRAYHIEEVKNSGGTLKIDINYYLTQQIHPVVSRLCEPLEGLDACQIANALSIDSSAFTVPKPKPNEDTLLAAAPIKSYAKAECFEFKCLGCKQLNVVSKLVQNKVLWLEKCCNEQCTVRPLAYFAAIQNKFMLDIQNYVDKYYEKTLICEDPLCPNETSAVPQKLIGKYPVCDMCDAGLMYSKYTARDVYEQLCYFKYLCDISKVPKKSLDPRIERAYRKMKRHVDFVLRRCQYGIIDITNLFANIFGAPGVDNKNADFIYEQVDELDWN